jgi:hypothetical protein
MPLLSLGVIDGFNNFCSPFLRRILNINVLRSGFQASRQPPTTTVKNCSESRQGLYSGHISGFFQQSPPDGHSRTFGTIFRLRKSFCSNNQEFMVVIRRMRNKPYANFEQKLLI